MLAHTLLFLLAFLLAGFFFFSCREKVVFLQNETIFKTMIRTNSIPTTSIADMYMTMLATLSVDDILDLIAKLSSSIINTKTREEISDDLHTMFCGVWGNADDLRNSEYVGREVLNW